ncbi:MAG: hypothetical protein A2681_02480 [Candidatus Liptonbacteria bacterium RIFCSPHIGHO2_01_FULL_56_18b]|nr:MAG: hypothetical protein UY96_C0023G0012 [Parcubacteria group bacterium GW2011_GWB1_56_8]OGY97843.1 MAG: hypothetical protein A2681_02480 [Candidatus Liptonbacteria bacterium RIFCSPHIGHO2_01_FULL_56_18b]
MGRPQGTARRRKERSEAASGSRTSAVKRRKRVLSHESDPSFPGLLKLKLAQESERIIIPCGTLSLIELHFDDGAVPPYIVLRTATRAFDHFLWPRICAVVFPDDTIHKPSDMNQLAPAPFQWTMHESSSSVELSGDEEPDIL